eukprot:gb/GECH01013142.1/.p1 GENE.gb/GECH01013142.1/~~gb/GECH01013142.1/.p1  ORF type:complete len:344 (+),score=113.97 gb/GECH01013142.1/:1-1032(+)
MESQQQQQKNDRYTPRLERQVNYEPASTSSQSNNTGDISSQKRQSVPQVERKYSQAPIEHKTLLNMYKFIQNQGYLLTEEERSTLARVQFTQVFRTGAFLAFGVVGGAMTHRMAKRAVSLPSPPKLSPILRNPIIRGLAHPWARPLLSVAGALIGVQISSRNAERRLLRSISELESPLGAMIRISLRESNSPQARRYLDNTYFDDREDQERLAKYVEKIKLRKDKIEHEESRVLQNVDDYGAQGHLRVPSIYFDSSAWEDTYGTGRDSSEEFKLPQFVRPDEDLDFHPEELGYDGLRIAQKIQKIQEEDDEYEYDPKVDSIPLSAKITAIPELNPKSQPKEEE